MFSCNTKISEGKLRKVTHNYFDPKLFSKSISLRVDSPKSNQEKKLILQVIIEKFRESTSSDMRCFSIPFEILQFCKVTVR